MTWDQLVGKIREGLGESGASLQLLGKLLAEVAEGDGAFSDTQVSMALVWATLAMSDLHSTVEHISIGLDAVVEALREADKSQEVKSE